MHVRCRSASPPNHRQRADLALPRPPPETNGDRHRHADEARRHDSRQPGAGERGGDHRAEPDRRDDRHRDGRDRERDVRRRDDDRGRDRRDRDDDRGRDGPDRDGERHRDGRDRERDGDSRRPAREEGRPHRERAAGGEADRGGGRSASPTAADGAAPAHRRSETTVHGGGASAQGAGTKYGLSYGADAGEDVRTQDRRCGSALLPIVGFRV